MKLKTLVAITLVALSMTACLKDKSAEQAPAPVEQTAAPTQVPAGDATQPTEAAPAAAPADSGNTQSAQ
jgi:hypothetical protein